MNIAIAVSPKRIGTESIQTINARELHAFLGVGKDFSNWIKDRIRKYGFTENQDFVSVEHLSSPNLASSKSRAQKTIEYHLTLDMAKEISMLENNDKGHEARRYFIECEKNLYTSLQAPKPETFDVLGGINVRKLEKAAKLHRSIRMLARNRGLRLQEQIEQADAVILQTTGFDIPKLLGLHSSYAGTRRIESRQTEKTTLRKKRQKIIRAITPEGVHLETLENETLNAGALAQYCGFPSAKSINNWLVNHGLQMPAIDSSGHQNYLPIGKGFDFGIVKSVPRQNSSGPSVPQLCWKAGFVEFVRDLVNRETRFDDEFRLR